MDLEIGRAVRQYPRLLVCLLVIIVLCTAVIVSSITARVAPTATVPPTAVVAVPADPPTRPAPTATPIPPPPPVVDVPSLLGASSATVRNQAGDPLTTDAVRAGVLRTIPGGGTSRIYQPGDDMLVTIFFDQADRARGMAIEAFDKTYTLDRYDHLLAALGFSITQEPDVVATGGLRWNDAGGYEIRIVGIPTTREVTMVNVTLVP